MKKYKFVFILLILSTIILLSCASKPVCNSPYMLVGEDCCLDKDNNRICDKDEKTNSQVIEQKFTNNQTIKNIDKKELAEKIALRFARAWESKDWEKMYDLLIDDLQRLRTKEDFIKTLNHFESDSSLVIRLDDVVIDNETTAFVYYTVNSVLFDTKAPSMRLDWNGEDWKVNSFSTYFIFVELPLKECNDFNKCTSDVYFFKEHKCKNKHINPCCGNKLCEKGESWNDCNSDCFSKDFKLKSGEDNKISFLGQDYSITIEDFKEYSKFLTVTDTNSPVRIYNLTINNNNFILDYEDEIKIKDNIYLKYKPTYGSKGAFIISISFILFNKN